MGVISGEYSSTVAPGDVISIADYRLTYRQSEQPADPAKLVAVSADDSAETQVMRSQTGEIFRSAR